MLSSAGFQPAVSPISNRQAVRQLPGTVGIVRLAGWKHCDTAGWKPALLCMARQSGSHLVNGSPLAGFRLTRIRGAGSFDSGDSAADVSIRKAAPSLGRTSTGMKLTAVRLVRRGRGAFALETGWATARWTA